MDKKEKTYKGKVVSDKMNKTIVVEVSRYVKHRKYKKYLSVVKKYKVHDEENSAKVGDKVEFKSGRPLSKTKSFVLIK